MMSDTPILESSMRSRPAHLETIVSHFEQRWLDGVRPSLDAHLAGLGAEHRFSVLVELVHVDLEFRLKAGETVRVEEYLRRYPELDRRDTVVALLVAEYRLRQRHEPELTPTAYLKRFPQHSEELSKQLGATLPTTLGEIPVGERQQKTADTPAGLDLRGYELIETLGKGGMGEVYRCCDPALGRDLAIKVIRAEYRGLAEAERRFLREARVTGSLQHPSIVPVHNLGRLLDGRLHYTMRLVRGRTFAGILQEEAGKPERLPYLLTIFEKICQAAAYAHSKHVIHRDLKPHNVMVGRFGEVQVMDWGLAKVLRPDNAEVEPEESMDAAGTRIPTELADTPVDLTRCGSGMGTPAYMPPEQALGEWDTVDERADVFALGSILCEMLTGHPAYRGTDGNDVYRRAKRGDASEALQRLQQCGADESLTALCRECLNPHREDRPHDADTVAKRVADHQAELQERLRQAELERVAAEIRAQEEQARAMVEQERAREALARVKAERRARQRLLALAAAVIVLLAGGSAGAWWMQQVRAAAQARQDQADREALAGLERARETLKEGWQLHDVMKLADAKTEAVRAGDIARSGSASDTVGQQIAAFQTEVQERLDRAKKNEQLLRDLLDIALPHESKTYQLTRAGKIMVMAEPSVEEQYAATFRRRWPDVDVDKQAPSEVAARLQEEPQPVLQGVIAGLDGWMVERWRQQPADAGWRLLHELVGRLDPNEQRRQLRALVTDGAPLSAASVAGLLGGRPPWPALWDLSRGFYWRRLRQLRGQMDASNEPVLTVILLSQASSAVGDMEGAEEVLRQALARRPDEVALLDALGKVLERQGRLTGAIGCYRAARAKQPGLGVSLALALGKAGQAAEGAAIFRDLVRQQPNNPEMFVHLGWAYLGQGKQMDAEAEAAYRKAIDLKPDDAGGVYLGIGYALAGQGKSVGAEAAFRKAIDLKPDDARAHYDLGNALDSQGKHTEAEAAFRKAIDLKLDNAWPYISLGGALKDQGRYVEAEAALRTAIALEPENCAAYNNLGAILNDHQGRHVEAEAAFRKAIDLKPDLAETYCNLGNALDGQGKHVEAEAAHRKAIDLKPDDAEIYYNLGAALKGQEKYLEAEAVYRKAIALKPDYAQAHCNLGSALYRQGRFPESLTSYRRGHELGSKQSGWNYPSLQWVRSAERLVELEKQLPAFLKGEASPANPSDGLILAWMCQQPHQKRYAASARLFADAFASDPKLAADLNQQPRYSAACSAALAAASQGEGTRLLPDRVISMYRRWALGWLRDDLTAYAKLAKENNLAANQTIQQRLAHWRGDPDLAPLRDPQALDLLPDQERVAWQSLWRDVDELVKRVTKEDETKATLKTPKQ